MVIKFLQLLTSPHRSTKTNAQLGCLLAFVAGAVNAGGFLAISRYTSHMSGIIAEIGDDLALNNLLAVFGAIFLLFSFIAGSATTTVLVHWGHRKNIHSQFALPLIVEAALLLIFGLLGASLNFHTLLTIPAIAIMLCFVMGLQNAIITQASKGEIRTTHMTGVVTDIGIELGKWLYWNRSQTASADHFVRVNKAKLRTHCAIFSFFLVGALVGAISFKEFGYVSVVPISLLLIVISSLQIYRDFRNHD
ncbi:DUF1275 family protein [Polynucleobacter sp. TUM22923]|jgi:uncharacterized membrane protein YoaK (UPF0700 family)|uniref:YoaK family protein n=1 Tax=Polynucleobacter sp. TUM22923 TaxID=3022126 RepID=UPI002573311E|nr:YoaK family protein [Polynucleobacter sp. TUM22923]BDX21051.1 DUF1275 family protein [Polynucleobacter sp. TUM22923]